MLSVVAGTARTEMHSVWWAGFTRLLQAAVDFKAASDFGRFPDPSDLAARAKDLFRFERDAGRRDFSPPVDELTALEETLWHGAGRYGWTCAQCDAADQWEALLRLIDCALSFPPSRRAC